MARQANGAKISCDSPQPYQSPIHETIHENAHPVDAFTSISKARELLSTDGLTTLGKPHCLTTSILHLSISHGMPGAYQAQHSADSIHGIAERMNCMDISEDEREPDHDPLCLPDGDDCDGAVVLLRAGERLVASTATRREHLLLTRPDAERYGVLDVHVAVEPFDGAADAGGLLWALWWGFGRNVHVVRRGTGASGEPTQQGLVTYIRCNDDVTHTPDFHLLYRGKRLNTIKITTLDADQRLHLMQLALSLSAREHLVCDGKSSVGTGELKTYKDWVEGLLTEAMEHGLFAGQECWPVLAQLTSW